MKNLVELEKYVTLNKSKNFSLLRNPHGLTTADIFFLGDFAIKDKSKEEVNSVAFRKKKSRLYEKLMREVISSDTNRLLKSNFDKLYHKCLRNILLANFFYLNYSRKIANELLERNVSLARKYHFTDVMINSVRLLRYHAAFGGNNTKFGHYSYLLEHNIQLLEVETKIEKYSQQLILEVHHFSTPNRAQKIKFALIYKKIARLVLKFPSRTNVLNFYRFGIRLNQFIQQHQAVLIICKKAEGYFQKNPHLIQKARLGEFALYRMGSCLQLGDLAEGRKGAKECDKLFQAGTDNWFIYNEWYFLLSMHNKDYVEGTAVLKQVINHPRLIHLQQVRIEKWKIYEAYISFVGSQTKENQFNLYKFLNDVPLHSSDKSGFNVSILIAQIISMINLNKFDDIIERSDALKIYCSRYIRISDSHRTYYFMKMLQVMIKYSFDPVKTEQIARKFYEQLTKSGKAGKSLEEMEVIPYDVLWISILQRLKEADKE